MSNRPTHFAKFIYENEDGREVWVDLGPAWATDKGITFMMQAEPTAPQWRTQERRIFLAKSKD